MRPWQRDDPKFRIKAVTLFNFILMVVCVVCLRSLLFFWHYNPPWLNAITAVIALVTAVLIIGSVRVAGEHVRKAKDELRHTNNT